MSDKDSTTDTKQAPANETENTDNLAHLTNADGEDPTDKNLNKIQIWFEAIQALGAVAAVAAVLVSLFTLLEMKTERDAAYKPKIVITPNVFVGNMEKEDDKEYLVINYDSSDSVISHYDDTSDNSKNIYIERPYLTLKNIGQGIAKDVMVRFSDEWIDSALDIMNDDPSDYYHFTVKTDVVYGKDSDYISYTTSDTDEQGFYLTYKEATEKNLTYIAPGDDSVKVILPDNWCTIFRALFKQGIQVKGPQASSYAGGKEEIDIPDPVITIEYSDIQGKTDIDTIVVPWTGHFTYSKSSALRNSKVESMDIFTGFYEDYIR